MKSLLRGSKTRAFAIIAVASLQVSFLASAEAEEFAAEQIKTAVEEIKAGLAKGEPSSVVNSCSTFSGMESHVKDVAAAKTLLDEGKKLCGFDLPLARAEQEVVKAEKARAADPKRKVLSECFSADWSMAHAELKAKFAEEEKFKALEARWLKVCPA